MTAAGSKTALNLLVTLLVAFSLSCGGSERPPTVPSPVTNDASVPFGAVVPDLTSCLGAPSPACLSRGSIHAASSVSRDLAPAPLLLTGSVVGTTVNLTWLPPLFRGVTSYVIEAGSAPGLSNLASFATGNTVSAFSAPGVPAGTYYIRVRAVDTTQVPGPPSNEVVVTVAASTPCTILTAPGALNFLRSDTAEVRLEWSFVSGATSYVLEAGSASGLANLASIDVGPAQGFVTSGVPAGRYFVRVRAKNACGISPPSREITLTVTTAPAPAPSPSPAPRR